MRPQNEEGVRVKVVIGDRKDEKRQGKKVSR